MPHAFKKCELCHTVLPHSATRCEQCKTTDEQSWAMIFASCTVGLLCLLMGFVIFKNF